MGGDTNDGGAAGVAVDRSTRRGFDPGVPADAIDRDVRVLSALANETRYRIIRLLSMEEEVCVCDIEASLDASQSAVSHALSSLHSSGLVDRRKEGRWRYYRVTSRAEAILGALDSTREGGDYEP